MQISKSKLDMAQARSQLTTKELQEKAKISDVTLARIRSGVQQPRPQTIGRIAAALGVDPAEIVKEG